MIEDESCEKHGTGSMSYLGHCRSCDLEPNDLRVEVFTTPGGPEPKHYARVTHIPTGYMGFSEVHSSQHVAKREAHEHLEKLLKGQVPLCAHCHTPMTDDGEVYLCSSCNRTLTKAVIE